MFAFLKSWLTRRDNPENDPQAPGQPVPRRIGRPSEEDAQAQRIQESDPRHYVSDSFTDPSARGGPLGTENDMPEGGDSTRGMSKGPASKSPMPGQERSA